MEEVNEQARERVLFVHAHPDDETIATGGTIATLVDSGAVVTVLTCTRGELGEVIPPDLAYLEGSGDELAVVRTQELRDAMRILGVDDHRFLGAANARWAGREPRRYLDSGMQWGDNGAQPLPSIDDASLCAAPLEEVVSDVAAVIASTRPSAVISYDETGGYGHPDHIRAHLASRRAAEAMGVPFFAIERPDSDEPSDPDGQAALVVDVAPVLERKRSALQSYRTQVTVEGNSYALSSGPAMPIASRERFLRMGQEPPATAWGDQKPGMKAVGCVLALVTGVALGALATVNHQVAVTWFGVQVGIGVAVSLALVAALLIGLRLVYEGRIMPGFAAIGVLVAVGVLSVKGPGGSVLVPADAAGWIWTLGPPIVAVVVLGWPRAHAGRSLSGSGGNRRPRRGPRR